MTTKCPDWSKWAWLPTTGLHGLYGEEKKKLISDYDNNSNQGEINRFKVVKNDKIFQPHTTAESTVNDPGMLWLDIKPYMANKKS